MEFVPIFVRIGSGEAIQIKHSRVYNTVTIKGCPDRLKSSVPEIEWHRAKRAAVYYGFIDQAAMNFRNVYQDQLKNVFADLSHNHPRDHQRKVWSNGTGESLDGIEHFYRLVFDHHPNSEEIETLLDDFSVIQLKDPPVFESDAAKYKYDEEVMIESARVQPIAFDEFIVALIINDIGRTDGKLHEYLLLTIKQHCDAVSFETLNRHCTGLDAERGCVELWYEQGGEDVRAFLHRVYHTTEHRPTWMEGGGDQNEVREYFIYDPLC